MIGVSRWFDVTRKRVDAFAEVTEDRQAIHMEDPAIAHGFLTLSLLSAMAYDAVPAGTGGRSINYGFDRLRFVSPVPVGARVRGHFERVSSEPAGEMTAHRWNVTVEIEGAERPALVAVWLTRTG